MCKAPMPKPPTPEEIKMKVLKSLRKVDKMNCNSCTINLRNTSMDYVECECCPVVLCARCDMNTKIMTVGDDCVIRCRSCYEYQRTCDTGLTPGQKADVTHGQKAVKEHPIQYRRLVLHSGNEILYESYNTLLVK